MHKCVHVHACVCMRSCICCACACACIHACVHVVGHGRTHHPHGAVSWRRNQDRHGQHTTIAMHTNKNVLPGLDIHMAICAAPYLLEWGSTPKPNTVQSTGYCTYGWSISGLCRTRTRQVNHDGQHPGRRTPRRHHGGGG